MKSLFNEYEAYSVDGSLLDNEVHRLIKPIFIKWMEQGFSARDIENIINDNTGIISAERRILKAIQMKNDLDKREVFTSLGKNEYAHIKSKEGEITLLTGE